MKKILLFLISVAMVGFTSCSKENMESSLPFGLPGTQILDMAIDNDHVLYFITCEIEKYVKLPSWSSASPYIYRYYLSKKTEEMGVVEILDDRYEGGKLYFDKKNQLLTKSDNTIYRIEGTFLNKIFELPYENPQRKTLASIAVDYDNNIWTGGFESGLYRIDSQLNVTHYHVGNSELQSNHVKEIYIDKNNDIFVVSGWVGSKGRILKISNGQWFFFETDSLNSHINHIITDKYGHLWIATGWETENLTLMRFEGTYWETINPRNEKNELVKAHYCSLLRSDCHRLYAVSGYFKTDDPASRSNELLTFDGLKWNKINDIPDDALIADLIVDNYCQVVWIRTWNKGIFKIPFKVD